MALCKIPPGLCRILSVPNPWSKPAWRLNNIIVLPSHRGWNSLIQSPAWGPEQTEVPKCFFGYPFNGCVAQVRTRNSKIYQRPGHEPIPQFQAAQRGVRRNHQSTQEPPASTSQTGEMGFFCVAEEFAFKCTWKHLREERRLYAPVVFPLVGLLTELLTRSLSL